VFKAHLRNPKIDCAIKVINKRMVNKNKVLKLLVENELQILQKTSHPKIVRTFEMLHDSKYFYIVMEFVKFGQLDDFLVSRRYLCESTVKKIIKQLFQALNNLHNLNIVHRDIKLENILIEDDETLSIKLTDFGFAKVFDGKNLNEFVGSPIFMSPEIISKKPYDSKVDIWSAGVLYILMHRMLKIIAQELSLSFFSSGSHLSST
jgi:serine/threonine protein kinase